MRLTLAPSTNKEPAISTNRRTVAFFWHHANKYPGYVWGLVVGVPIALLAQQFIPPIIAANVLERLSAGDFQPENFWAIFGSQLMLYAGLTFFGSVIGWRVIILLIWRLEIKVQRDLAQRAFTHLIGQDASFHANKFGGSLVSQVNKFTSAYVRLADTTVFNMYILLLTFIFTAVILGPKVPLYVVVLFVFSAIFIATAFAATKKVRELNVLEAEAQNAQTGVLADGLTNIMAVKSFAADEREIARFAEATDRSYAAGANLMRASIKRDTYFALVNGTVTSASLMIAALSVVFFNADIATVFLVLSYTGMIVMRLAEFGRGTLRQYNRAFGDSQEMIKILDTEPQVKDLDAPEKSRITHGKIDFQNVVFRHDNDTEALFKDFDLHIKPGEKIGLVGHSGAGKTTLTRLLLRFANLEAGDISIDGQDITRISQLDLRQSIAYVPQEPLLFHRSLQENIAYGKHGATQKQIETAARKAHATEFIEKLPDGLATLVGERGIKLSGGQRQRIAIARAILKDAPILVLDEATSALDSDSEQHIQAALWELMKGRTAIVIAHRLSTIQKMDRIVVLDEGKIVEEGSHAALLKKNGVYARLWQHQSGGFIES